MSERCQDGRKNKKHVVLQSVVFSCGRRVLSTRFSKRTAVHRFRDEQFTRQPTSVDTGGNKRFLLFSSFSLLSPRGTDCRYCFFVLAAWLLLYLGAPKLERPKQAFCGRQVSLQKGLNIVVERAGRGRAERTPRVERARQIFSSPQIRHKLSYIRRQYFSRQVSTESTADVDDDRELLLQAVFLNLISQRTTFDGVFCSTCARSVCTHKINAGCIKALLTERRRNESE